MSVPQQNISPFEQRLMVLARAMQDFAAEAMQIKEDRDRLLNENQVLKEEIPRLQLEIKKLSNTSIKRKTLAQKASQDQEPSTRA